MARRIDGRLLLLFDVCLRESKVAAVVRAIQHADPQATERYFHERQQRHQRNPVKAARS